MRRAMGLHRGPPQHQRGQHRFVSGFIGDRIECGIRRMQRWRRLHEVKRLGAAHNVVDRGLRQRIRGNAMLRP